MTVSFRDEVGALRARVEALEGEVERLREANEALRAGAVGDLGAAIQHLRAVFAGLREALLARGASLQHADLYVYEKVGYDGFYGRWGERSLFLGLHLGGAVRHGLAPIVVQLVRVDPARAARALGERWRVRDQALLGWNQGPFVDLALEPGLSRDAQVARLLEEIDAIALALDAT